LNPISFEQTLHILVWSMALLEFMLASYALAMNFWHTANRYLAGFLLLLAINSTATALMLGAETVQQAMAPAVLLAITIPMIQPVLLSACIVLLRPNWQRSRLKWLVWLGYLLAAIPLAATIFDLITRQGIWLEGLESINYQGGFISLIEFTRGTLADIIWPIAITASGVALLLTLLYLSVLDTQVFPRAKRLGWLLCVAQLSGIVLHLGLRDRLLPVVPVLLTNLLLAGAFSYASFRQMASERRFQRGQLQIRLTVLTLIVTIPILVSVLSFLTSQAAYKIEQNATERMKLHNQNLQRSIEIWLDGEMRALQDILNQDAVRNMTSTAQEEALNSLAATHPWIDLASITDINGMAVASNDPAQMPDVSDQAWFEDLLNGADSVAEVWDHPINKTPALVLSLPVHDQQGMLSRIGVFSLSLTKLSELLNPVLHTEAGEAYIVDSANRIILRTGSNTASIGTDLSGYPPVLQLRNGDLGAIQFNDSNGEIQRAYLSKTSKDWGIIYQQPEAIFLEPVRLLQLATWLLVTLCILIVSLLVWFTLRQALRPISTLTATAKSITTGNLSRAVPVESEDELGNLARSMNDMITQLRGLIIHLEQRVTERTQDVQRRALQLQVTAEVARESASIRELERLLDHTVHLISERFNFYHTGIFLIDDAGEYAVLRAASSEGGQRMLSRGHKLRIGQTGIVGYVAEKAESRIALDVGQDAVYFNNPDLPQTRSEAALPLMVREHVIGVLDVQSPQIEAFNSEDIETLQVLADQIALAIENAQLFDENRQALNELQSLYGTQVRQAWQGRLEERSITYVYDRLGVQPALPNAITIEPDSNDDQYLVEVPIELRGWQLGMLQLKRDQNQAPWTRQDRELLQDAAHQIALALENARLLETVQRNAYHEQVIGQIASKAQSSLVLENVMKTAVQEIGQAIQAARVQIRLHPGNDGHSTGIVSDQTNNTRS